ncbi:MAG: hypothetical protein ABIN48_00570 [Ginsengibacter sp.]
MYKFLLAIFLSIGISQISFGQDTLPKLSVSKLGRKVIVSWVNPYKNVVNINIQRSADSLKGFTTIGSVINVDAQTNGFVDTKEFLPSNQYYRLFISFTGGSYIFTESHRPSEDTTNIEVPIEIPVIIEEPGRRALFVPSKHVYTGKDNNIIIFLKDAEKKKYSIRFFEDDGTFLFEINRITEPYLILDKVNFMHSGLFNFELFDNRIIIEKHKFFIPQDGKPMPLLDVNGYELNRK